MPDGLSDGFRREAVGQSIRVIVRGRKDELAGRIMAKRIQKIHHLKSVHPGLAGDLLMQIPVSVIRPRALGSQRENGHQRPCSLLLGRVPDAPKSIAKAEPFFPARSVEVALVVAASVDPHLETVPPQVAKAQEVRVPPPDRRIEVLVQGGPRIRFRIVQHIAYDHPPRMEGEGLLLQNYRFVPGRIADDPEIKNLESPAVRAL